MRSRRFSPPERSGGGQGKRMRRIRAPSVPASDLDSMIVDLLSGTDTPLSAYDLVERIRERGRRVVPMSVYRALDRLCARDAVQKVEMLSAYRVRDVSNPILLICMGCGSIAPVDADDLHHALAERLAISGFRARIVAVEVAGLCGPCREATQ